MSTTSLTSGSNIPASRARENGWWGMAIFAATEATLIGSIIGSYFYLRFNTSHWPPPGTPKPALLGPIVLTVALVASLVPFQAAVSAARRGLRGRTLALVALATCIQGVYLAIQIHLFVGNLTQFTPQQSAYGSIYYVLLGADHAHVAVGLLFDVWLLARLSSRLTPYRLVALEASGLYWIVVAALTVAVTATELSARL